MLEQVEATAKLAPCPHCSEHHSEDQLRCSKTDLLLPFEGRRLDGKFRFLSSLGTGGMASVWLARNERVDREVAIKFLRPEVGRDPEAVARFRSEARAAGRIGNKHICEILDLGDSPIGPYIVMERLRGLDLAALIRRQGRLQPSYAVRIVRHALEGLAAAHAAGIVHRDLKPGNVFLHRTDEGDTQVKLMDFGVSKFLDGTGDAMTASGILLGTPEYMAPEQLEGANKLGPPADIFAIGAILYRAITGQLVFSGANLAAVLRSMAIDTPTPVDQLIEGLPPELVAIIHRCLERDPAARFATAEALSDALAPFEQFDGEVLPLQPPDRISHSMAAAAHSRHVDSGAEPRASAILELEPDPDSQLAEPVESATNVWKQDASGPLRSRDPEQAPTATRMPSPAAADEPEPADLRGPGGPLRPERRAVWPWLGLVGSIAVVLALLGREWSMGRFTWVESAAPLVGAETEDLRANDQAGSDTGAETAVLTNESETGETSSTGESESESESETTDAATDDDSGAGQEFSTDRPAPAGTFRSGGYISPNEHGPLGDQAAARKYCDDLAARRVAGVGKWQLANPSAAGAFIGSDIKSSRYWTSAIWQGKARVYTLPRGKKDSEKIDKKIARPLCVTRW